MNSQAVKSTFFQWSIPIGLGLAVTAWYPFSSNPGIIGKFLGVYVLGILVTAWALKKILSSGFSTNIIRPDLALLVMVLGAVAVSAVVSQSPLTIAGHSKHHEGVLAFLFYALIYLLAADEKSPINVRSVSAVLGGSVILNLLIGYTPLEQSIGLEFGRRFTGSFAEPNYLAGFLVISIPLLAFLVIDGQTVWKKAFGAIALTCALIQLFLSQSRSGYLALALASLIFAIVAYIKSTSRFRPLYALVPLTLLFGSIFSNRLSLSSLKEGTLQRFGTWGSIDDTWGYILIGPGPGRFQLASENRHLMVGPHNAYINYAGNIGWLAVIAYVLLIILAMHRALLYIKQSKRIDSIGITFLLTSIAGYALFSTLSYTRVYTNLVFWALLGLTVPLTSHPRAIKLPKAARVVSATLFVVSILAAAGILVQSISGSWHMKLAMRADDDIERWNHLSQAISYEPSNVEYRLVRGDLAMRFLNVAGREQLSAQIVASAIEDWGFLYAEAFGDINSYLYLDTFYFLADTPVEDKHEPPSGYDPAPVQQLF